MDLSLTDSYNNQKNLKTSLIDKQSKSIEMTNIKAKPDKDKKGKSKEKNQNNKVVNQDP